MICLNDKFSTTRMVTTIKPIINNQPDDKFNTLLFLPKNYHRKFEGGLRTQGYFKQNSPENALVTIITVVFNGEKYLEETILSVINQTYNNVEYIIIDGGSTDGTLEIIGKYENAIDYWVSEPDQGIYDAMNKGISLSLGKYIGLINSDDWYSLRTVESVVCAFQKNHADIVFGAKISINEKLAIAKKIEVQVPRKLKDVAISSVSSVHPTVFVDIAVYKNILFDSSLKIAADTKFFIDAFIYGFTFFRIESILAYMRSDGKSSNFNLERLRIYTEYRAHFSIIDYLNQLIIKNIIVIKFIKLPLLNLVKSLPRRISREIFKRKGWFDIELLENFFDI